MTTYSEEDMSINVAVYMERLDNYIASQTAINENISRTLDSLHHQLDDINVWRSKVYGAKSGILAIALITAVEAGLTVNKVRQQIKNTSN